MVATGAERATYSARAERAATLAAEYTFAAEILDFAAAVFEVQGRAFELARAERPALDAVPALAAARVMPEMVAAASRRGPAALGDALGAAVYSANLEGLASAWLAGTDGLTAAETFLARASVSPLLEALPGLLPAPADPHSLQCPACGAPPQLSYFESTGETLLTGRRYLQCARCGEGWAFPRMVCAGCGEAMTAKLPILADHGVLPHLRADACDSCRQYLVTVDCSKDPAAVPAVDEIAAVPLCMIAEERGFRKLARNLFGL